ncbi:MAG: RHS repeat protein, partial [Kiritimatiellae bacterium]|nr:RHS repeat protein [Kiritimatiellia bacterium]
RSGVLTASNGGEFRWTYLPNSDLKSSLTYPNGLTASWTYDANNQLLQVRNATPTNVISQFDYTYDAAGRRTAIAKSGSAFGDLSGSIDSYTYNARSELTSARRTKNGQPIPGFSEDFDYDPIGNRRSSSTYNEKGEAQTSTYEANNLNQYTSRTTPGYAAVRGEADPNATVMVNENPTFRFGSYYFGSDLFDNTAAGGLANLETYATLGQTAANGEEADDLVSAETNQVYLAQSPETFAYDDDGNQTLITTKTGLWRVTYNGENRPILWENLVAESNNQTISNQTILTMSYDHMGRRREKNAQHFFYDGYLQVAANVGNVYTWDCTETVATRPLAWNRGNFSDYYTHDGNKNVSEVIAVNGTFAAHYDYAPFGAVIAQCGASAAANPWRFSSEFAEAACDGYYYNDRYCASGIGRWMNRDLIEGLDPMLSFCRNNPVCFYDYIGESTKGLSGIFKYSLQLLKYLLKNHFGDIEDAAEKLLDLYEDSLEGIVFRGLNICQANYETGRCPACCVIVYTVLRADKEVFVFDNASVEKNDCSQSKNQARIFGGLQKIEYRQFYINSCK